MNVADEILIKNIKDRKSRNEKGDYLKIDMFSMKKDIEIYFNKITNDYIKYITNINTVDDYELEFQKIITFISDILRTS